MPYINKDNGSEYWTLYKMVKRFYTSRFNRDPYREPIEGEDIDNSTRYRVYGMTAVRELLEIFIQYFQWVIIEENVSKVYLSDDLVLIRESILPRVKPATQVDVFCASGEVKDGDYYVTPGKYTWKMWVQGDTFKGLKELSLKDPQMERLRKELAPIAEEKNNAKRNTKNKSSK